LPRICYRIIAVAIGRKGKNNKRKKFGCRNIAAEPLRGRCGPAIVKDFTYIKKRYFRLAKTQHYCRIPAAAAIRPGDCRPKY